ncbi:MAG: tRNA-dihydrouridine synthase [Planctomycetota bacterium]|nr:tRNA-dihydrouridine synthase [Planctomycetota bacterium]MDA1213487.1 tRNA-dihydrouridine synthase [Planctomycetota bacterium]
MDTTRIPDPTSADAGPLKIGSRVIPSRYNLSPLAGYTHLPFRRAIRELGGLGLATTDLVQATFLLSGNKRTQDLVATVPADQPMSVQIYGGQRTQLLKAARWLEDHGYQGIDLNMGCPMAKITGQGGGARLMCDESGACNLVGDLVNTVNVPVTVKMRLGWDRDQLTAPALAHEFEQLGVAAITIHGRTRQQGFHGSVDLDGIRAVVEAVEKIPVIGNGDVRTVVDAFHMRQYTGCAGVAIGRGALLDPWIFLRIERAEQQIADTDPTPDEQIHFLTRHFTMMHEQHGEYGCVMFRKFAAWYGDRLGIPDDLEDRLRRCSTLEEFHTLIPEIRERHGQRQQQFATALLKVPNGPNANW